jgi:iron(III) transport system substrate-binding protein
VDGRQSTRAIPWLCAGLVLAALWVGGALAQPTGMELATYDGPDRLQKIIEGARKEGDVVLYTSMPADDMKALADAFERKYGIKAKIWRASADKVLQRGTSEARANRYEVDVLEADGPAMEGLLREKLLAVVRSPVQDDLVPEARLPHQFWVRARYSVYALAYNTKSVPKADLPKSYEGLLDSRWKGKLGIEAEDGDWFSAVSQQLGEQKAQKLFKEIVAKNGVTVRHGHGQLTELVATGDIPLAITVYTGKVEALKRKGAPIDWFVIPPAIARGSGVGVAARAVHPNAALLWYEFELSDEGQKVIAERGFTPTNRLVSTALERVPLRFIDPRIALDEGEKWDKRFAEIFVPPKSERVDKPERKGKE